MTAYGTAIVRTKKNGKDKIMDVDLSADREHAVQMVTQMNSRKTLPANIRWAVVKIEVVEP